MPDDKTKRGGPIVHRVLSQDLYSTGLHGDDIGIKQSQQWRAQSRQFNKDCFIIGKIMEADLKKDEKHLPPLKKTGFVAIRSSLWSDESKDLSKRLVIKLFSDSGNWLATIEEMMAEEYAISFASEMPLLTFCVITEESEIVTYIRQLRRGALATESYSFYLPGPDGKFEVFNIDLKRVSAGADFKVVLLSGDVEVAQIDSKFGDIGGEFAVSINDFILSQNEMFCKILQCFSAAIKFRGEMRARIERGLKEWSHGKDRPLQHRYELSLLANPRRLTLKTDELSEV